MAKKIWDFKTKEEIADYMKELTGGPAKRYHIIGVEVSGEYAGFIDFLFSLKTEGKEKEVMKGVIEKGVQQLALKFFLANQMSESVDEFIEKLKGGELI